MEHLTLKAVTTTTDQGVFEAVISTENSDREKDVVSAAAMVTALRKWNRPLPLAWEHSSEAEHIFGVIDTQSAREVAGEVVVSGHVDMESRVGKEAWRSFKSRTIGFSFGYLILQSTNIKGGGRKITELDVFEVTATATPMNNDTRVLFTKALEPAELRRKTFDAAVEAAEGWRKPTKDEEPVVSDEEMKRAKSVLLFLRDNPDLEPDAVAVFSKTVWTKTYIDALPDEHFLYVDAEKVRHFAFKDAEGAVDLPHLRQALAVIPKSKKLSRSRREALVKDAREILEQAIKALGPPAEPVETKREDPLRQRTYGVALEVANDGMKVPRRIEEKAPDPEPEIDPSELRRRTFDLALDVATG